MSDYEYDYEDDDYQMEEENNQYEELDNLLLEVEDNINIKKYDEAKSILRNIILLNENQEERKYTFKAYIQLIILNCELNKCYDEIEKDLSIITVYLKPQYCISKNEATESITKVLIAIQKLQNQDQSSQYLEQFLNKLESLNLQSYWFSAALQLCKSYYENNKTEKLKPLLQVLELRCNSQNQTTSILTDNSQILLDLYSYQIQLAIQEDNIMQVKKILKKSEEINTSIFNSKSYAIIKENSGKLMMIDRQYKQASEDLLEAFHLYSSLTNPQKAKEMLKYITICSILLHSTINIFHSQEAQQFQTDLEMINLQNLRYFYENKDLKKFQNLFQEQFKKDIFICKFKDQLLKLIAMERIEVIIQTYRRIKISYLAEVIGVKDEQILKFLIELIMEGKINGKINMVEQFFENFALITDQKQQKKIKAIQSWIDMIQI